MTSSISRSLEEMRDERDHLAILLNLSENGEEPDGPETEALRKSLTHLEERIAVMVRRTDRAGSKMSQI